MFENRVWRAGPGVIADVDDGRERGINSFHHIFRAGAHAAKQRGARVDVRWAQVVLAAVPIAHHDLGRTGEERARDRRVGFPGHDGAKHLVVWPGCAHVGVVDHAGESFHIDRDEDLRTTRGGRLRGQRRSERRG